MNIILMAAMSLLFSAALMAHPGHGVEGPVHDAVHFSWFLAAFLLAAIIIYKLPRFMKEKFRKK